MAHYHLVLCLALFATVSGLVIETTPCSGEDESSATCTVSEVRIEPCTKPSKCIIRRPKNCTISFDFTPKFSSPTLSSMVYWRSPAGDVEYQSYVSKDTCKFTTCPTVAETTQTYNYNLYITKYIPKDDFPLKWKVWNEQNPSEKCCFNFAIRIIGK